MAASATAYETLAQEIVDPRSPVIFALGRSLSPDEPEALRAALHQLDCVVSIVVCSEDSKEGECEAAIIDQIAKDFAFPEYFGRNWNAMDECLGDLSWSHRSRHCCILRGSAVLRTRYARIYDLVVDVFMVAGQSWAKEGVSLKLVLG